MSKIRWLVLFAVVFGLVEGGRAPGQQLIYSSQTANFNVSVGDIDADGFPDLRYGWTVYSSANWQPIQTFSALPVSLGDVNNDGLVEVAIYDNGGTPPTVSVIDPRTGQVFWSTTQISFFGAVAIKDTNGNGSTDLMVGYDFLQPLHIDLTDGLTGQVLSTFSLPNGTPGELFDYRSIGDDIDGDGIDDIIVGLPRPASITSPPGEVYLVSGATGALIQTIFGTAVGGQFGFQVSGIRDVDGDGISDLLIFEPGVFNSGVILNTSQGIGRVHTYSGATRALIATFPCTRCLATAWWQFSGAPFFTATAARAIALDDVDGDGAGDYAVSALNTQASFGPVTEGVEVYSGRSGQRLIAFPSPPGYPASATYSPGMSSLPDIDGDGVGDIGMGAVQGGSLTSYLWSLRPAGVTFFGQGCLPSSAPKLRVGAGGEARSGGTLTMNCSGLAPGAFSMLMIGLSDQQWYYTPLPLDLTSAGLPGCNLLVEPMTSLSTFAVPIGPINSMASITSVVAPSPNLTGSVAFGQWVVEAPTPTTGSLPLLLSRGIRVVFQ